MRAGGHPVTPDGRYFVVCGRLWRMSDPGLAADRRDQLVKQLMAARRAVADARRRLDATAEASAHGEIDAIKTALGERGPVWWEDGAADYNGHMARTTPYAEWFKALGNAGRSGETVVRRPREVLE